MDAWAFGLCLLVLFTIGLFIVKIAKFHKCKYGEIQEDGFQYCSTCNHATEPIKQPCFHEWKVRESAKITTTNQYGRNERITGKSFILECKHCGDLKHFLEKI
jgi:hypothetical protein